MSDEDPGRQPASVNKLLDAFFGSPKARTEIQLLADEVGMGKTFVALATAYAVLDVLRHKPGEEQPPDLKKCYRAVVVVTPAGNHALTEKWHREVEAFRTRCSRNVDATRWFQSRICTTPEDLVESLCRAHDLRRDPTKSPCVIVCQGNIFTRRYAGRWGTSPFPDRLSIPLVGQQTEQGGTLPHRSACGRGPRVLQLGRAGPASGHGGIRGRSLGLSTSTRSYLSPSATRAAAMATDSPEHSTSRHPLPTPRSQRHLDEYALTPEGDDFLHG
jgi:hypothetical protein